MVETQAPPACLLLACLHESRDLRMLFVIQVDHDDHGPVPAMYRVKTPKTVWRNSATFTTQITRSRCNPWRVMTGVLRFLDFFPFRSPKYFKVTIVNLSSALYFEFSAIKPVHVTLVHESHSVGHARSIKSYTEHTCSASDVTVVLIVASSVSLNHSSDILM